MRHREQSRPRHDFLDMIAFITREQIPLCQTFTVFRMNGSARTRKANPRLALLSCFSEQSVRTWPYALTLIEVQHPASPRSRSRALLSPVRQSNCHIPVLSTQPCTLELNRENKALVCPGKELRRCSSWSRLLAISSRADCCFAFVYKSSKRDKAQHFTPCFHGMRVTDQKDAETHINTAVSYSRGLGGPCWPEQAGSGEMEGARLLLVEDREFE